MRSFLLFGLILFFVSAHFAQEYRFNQYTSENGISQNFIYSIHQDAQGYLWIGTGEGLSRFDGKNFKNYTVANGLAEDVITSSFEADNGTVWFGHNEGGITKFKDGEFKTITSKSAHVTGKINSFTQAGKSIFFVSQNQGVFKIENDNIYFIGKFEKSNFFCLESFDDTHILIGTDEGDILIQEKEGSWNKTASNHEENWVSAMAASNEPGIILIGTKEGQLFKSRIFEGKIQFSLWNNEMEFSDYQIQHITQDKNGNIWLGTFGQGLIKLEVNTTKNSGIEIIGYNEKTGLSSNFVQSAFQDREGNIWIGTFGKGLYRLIDDFFTFYKNDLNPTNENNITAIWKQGNTKCYGLENGLVINRPKEDTEWYLFNSENGFVNDKVSCLFHQNESLWIGTEKRGLYLLNLIDFRIDKIDMPYGSLVNHINQITVADSMAWIATEGGLVVYNIKEKSSSLLDTQIGLAHNSIKSVYRDEKGKIWLGTKSRFLFCLTNQTVEEFEITTRGELEIIDIAEDRKGNIWLATSEYGIYKMEVDEFIHYSTQDGLKSNYCYTLSKAVNGDIWVGHRGGLSRISTSDYSIQTYDHESGIDAQINYRSDFIDDKGNLWFGSDKGAIQYNPQKDENQAIAPVINLLSVKIGEKLYRPEEEPQISYDQYRIEFDFIGISFDEPDEVTYRYKLVGHDEVYSNPTKETTVAYSKIKDGDYTFEVISCNSKNECNSQAAEFSFSIGIPFWKAWWFYLLVLSCMVLIVYVLIRLRVRRFKATQTYLEERLAFKTKEVVEKAEKIEEINIDLTASINYAERIQSAILPDIDVLNKYFEHSFILFKPRDVVSGDFYFVREYDNRLIVACCDCTGHGVPGAFMSMIGATTLRNIYKMMESSGEWKTPEKVLEKLDDEIQKILHQQEFESSDSDDMLRSGDGMDLTIAEIHIKTKEVLLASAKRHSFIRQNGKIEIISGDKRAIGGADILKTPFQLLRFKMAENDALFIFSDGYPDQFGGTDGRKLKLSGTSEILSKLNELPKNEYSKRVKSAFEQWQGDFDQIDDVLFMGMLF